MRILITIVCAVFLMWLSSLGLAQIVVKFSYFDIWPLGISLIFISAYWLIGRTYWFGEVLDHREWRATDWKTFPPEQEKAPEPIRYQRVEK